MRPPSTWHLKRSWSFLLGFRRLDLPYAFRRRHGVVYDYITTLVSRQITKDFSGAFPVHQLGLGISLMSHGLGSRQRPKGWNGRSPVKHLSKSVAWKLTGSGVA